MKTISASVEAIRVPAPHIDEVASNKRAMPEPKSSTTEPQALRAIERLTQQFGYSPAAASRGPIHETAVALLVPIGKECAKDEAYCASKQCGSNGIARADLSGAGQRMAGLLLDAPGYFACLPLNFLGCVTS